MCLIGYPVLDKKLDFKNDLATNVEDWNKYLMISRVSRFFFKTQLRIN